MLCFLFKNLDRWQRAPIDFSSFADFYTSCLAFSFVLDVAFGCVGYLLMLRLLNAHIRHPEETATGWISALVCYPPLLTAFGGSYFRFNAERSWPHVLEKYPVSMISWGFLIILLYVIYV